MTSLDRTDNAPRHAQRFRPESTFRVHQLDDVAHVLKPYWEDLLTLNICSRP